MTTDQPLLDPDSPLILKFAEIRQHVRTQLEIYVENLLAFLSEYCENFRHHHVLQMAFYDSILESNLWIEIFDRRIDSYSASEMYPFIQNGRESPYHRLLLIGSCQVFRQYMVTIPDPDNPGKTRPGITPFREVQTPSFYTGYLPTNLIIYRHLNLANSRLPSGNFLANDLTFARMYRPGNALSILQEAPLRALDGWAGHLYLTRFAKRYAPNIFEHAVCKQAALSIIAARLPYVVYRDTNGHPRLYIALECRAHNLEDFLTGNAGIWLNLLASSNNPKFIHLMLQSLCNQTYTKVNRDTGLLLVMARAARPSCHDTKAVRAMRNTLKEYLVAHIQDGLIPSLLTPYLYLYMWKLEGKQLYVDLLLKHLQQNYPLVDMHTNSSDADAYLKSKFWDAVMMFDLYNCDIFKGITLMDDL